MLSLRQYLTDNAFEQIENLSVCDSQDGYMRLYVPNQEKPPWLFCCKDHHPLPLVILKFRIRRKRLSNKERYRRNVTCGLLVLKDGTSWFRFGGFSDAMRKELAAWDVVITFHEYDQEESLRRMSQS